MTVNLELDEWQRVLVILAQAPWSQANPLIMKIGEQLRARPNGPDEAERKPEWERPVRPS